MSVDHLEAGWSRPGLALTRSWSTLLTSLVILKCRLMRVCPPDGGRGAKTSHTMHMRPKPQPELRTLIFCWPKQVTQSSPKLREVSSASSCVPSHFSHVQLFVTLWTVAHQALLSMGVSRQEYWSGLPSPPPGDLPNPGIEPLSLMSSALAEVPPRKPYI